MPAGRIVAWREFFGTPPRECMVSAVPPRAGLVGPLFYYELLRLARRGRSTVLRCAYALTILIILWSVHASESNPVNLGFRTASEPPGDRVLLARTGRAL